MFVKIYKAIKIRSHFFLFELPVVHFSLNLLTITPDTSVAPQSTTQGK